MTLSVSSTAWALEPVAGTGPDFPLDAVRPASMPGRTVSWEASVSVHAAQGTSAETIVQTERAAVRAIQVLTGAHRFPWPAPDGMRGGGSELDVYLVPPADRSVPGEAVADGLAYGGVLQDSAPSFVRVRNDLDGVALERAVTEGVAQAILWGIDAREQRSLRLAMAADMALHVMGHGMDTVARDAFLRNASLPVLSGRDDLASRGAALFVEYMVSRFQDTHDPLMLVRGLAWMPVTHSWPGASRMNGEPDALTCLWLLTAIDQDRTGGIEKVFTDFSITTALMGTPALREKVGYFDPGPGAEPAWLARVVHSNMPQVVVGRPLLHELSTALVDVDTRGAGDASIHAWFHGVPWRHWRVTALRIDANGQLLGQIPDAPVVNGEWGTSVVFYKDCARIVFVVVDAGSRVNDIDAPLDGGDFFKLHLDKGV